MLLADDDQTFVNSGAMAIVPSWKIQELLDSVMDQGDSQFKLRRKVQSIDVGARPYRCDPVRRVIGYRRTAAELLLLADGILSGRLTFGYIDLYVPKTFILTSTELGRRAGQRVSSRGKLQHKTPT
jgi:hypothetical protein